MIKINTRSFVWCCCSWHAQRMEQNKRGECHCVGQSRVREKCQGEALGREYRVPVPRSLSEWGGVTLWGRGGRFSSCFFGWGAVSLSLCLPVCFFDQGGSSKFGLSVRRLYVYLFVCLSLCLCRCISFFVYLCIYPFLFICVIPSFFIPVCVSVSVSISTYTEKKMKCRQGITKELDAQKHTNSCKFY